MLSFEWLIFLLSSVVTLAAIYYKLSIPRLQQITALLLIIILFILNRFVFSRSRQALTLWPRLVLLLFSSLIIQLIVLSTGGFFSPFPRFPGLSACQLTKKKLRSIRIM